MSNTKYKQCMLQRGVQQQVSWIPSCYAVVGNVLKLKDKGGAWEDGWKVVSVGTETDEKFIPDSYAAIKSLWRATSGPTPIGHK